MPSNLPPGCTSADGGIDHAMEAALDDLCQAVETVEGARALQALAPIIEKHISAAIAEALKLE